MCQHKRENRTVTVDFNDKSTYFRLIQDRKAFIEFIVAFILAIGFQLKHKAHCCGGFSLTPHSSCIRLRLNGLPIWRVQCTKCKAVFTILPHFVLRYLAMSPEDAEKALLAASGGLSLEVCAELLNITPMAIWRLLCAVGKTGLVTFLTRCALPLPKYFIADEKHSFCLKNKVCLATVVAGRVIWLPGYTLDKSAEAFEASYEQFRRAALEHDPSWEPGGILTDGFASTIRALKKLFPSARIGNCILHAAKKVMSKLRAVPKTVREELSHSFYELFRSAKERKGLKLFSFGQKLRRFAEKVRALAGSENAEKITEWIRSKKGGWYKLFEDSRIPATSTLPDQAHNAIDRKLFMMKGFHHPDGGQQAFLNAMAILYNIIPYQRRAVNAGKCGIQVEGGKLPSENWFRSIQILTSGGFK